MTPNTTISQTLELNINYLNISDKHFENGPVSCGAAGQHFSFHAFPPARASTMSAQTPNSTTNHRAAEPGPIETPCFATCINLQGMHHLSRERLELQYKKYYTIIKYEIDPTPEHLGAWVQVSGVGEQNKDGSREWLPAHFFYINLAIWPN